MTNNKERWIVTGATGQLGSHAIHALKEQSPDAVIMAMSRRATPDRWLVESAIVDLAETDTVVSTIERFAPTHVLHLGAMTAVSEAYNNPKLADQVNVQATQAIADTTARLDARMVFASTDMVFDGRLAPYTEDATPRPISNYGRSKASAEAALAGQSHIAIVRFPLMFGIPKIERSSTVVNQIQALRDGTPLNLFTDEFRTPLWLGDAAAQAIQIARLDVNGIFHCPGPERLSRLQMVERFATALNIKTGNINAISRLDIDSPETRPEDLSLSSIRTRKVLTAFSPQPICTNTLS